jgi:hypothetical protein
MMRFVMLGILALALSACASSPPVVQPVEVRVPVAVPCKTPTPSRPAFAVDALSLGAGIWEQMSALRAERIQRQGYILELEAAVKACSYNLDTDVQTPR